MVLERVDRDGGQVKLERRGVDGAQPIDEDDVLEPGTRVQVMKIEGATALVSDRNR